MTLPGDRLRHVASAWLSDDMCRQFVDPIVADLQHEYSTVPRDQLWHRRFVHARAVFALVHGLVVFGIGRLLSCGGDALRRDYSPPSGVAAGAAIGTLTLFGVAAADLVITSSYAARNWPLLLLLLLPEALPVAVPVGLAVAAAAVSSSRTRARARASLCLAALVGTAGLALSLDRAIPAANQEFRTLLFADHSRPPSRGATELSFRELAAAARKEQAAPGPLFPVQTGEPPARFWLHGRIALSFTPLLMTLVTLLAMASLSPTFGRAVAIGMVAAFLASYIGVDREDYAAAIEAGVAPWFVAWAPNLAIALVGAVIHVRALRGDRPATAQ